MKLYGMQDVGTIDYTASTTKKLALPRNRFLQAVYLYVKITGDTAGSVTADEEKAAALIKRVRIEAGQADNPLDLKGIDLWRFNKYNQGVVPRNSLSTTVSQSNITLGEYQAKMAFALSQNPWRPRTFSPRICCPPWTLWWTGALRRTWGRATPWTPWTQRSWSRRWT